MTDIKTRTLLDTMFSDFLILAQNRKKTENLVITGLPKWVGTWFPKWGTLFHNGVPGFPKRVPVIWNEYSVSRMGYPVFVRLSFCWRKRFPQWVTRFFSQKTRSPFQETRHSIQETGYSLRETGYSIWETVYYIREPGTPFGNPGTPFEKPGTPFRKTGDDQFFQFLAILSWNSISKNVQS